ncbi:MAG: phospholipase D-like domain-containing protein [Endomicrobiales bacterium]|nr:phospholipase D-like domain-containing protein [Endomicrobiales bacterium]
MKLLKNKTNILPYQLLLLFLFLFTLSCSKSPIAQTAKIQQNNQSAIAVLNNNYLSTALELINSAKQSVLISQLYYKNDNATTQITNALKTALKRNVLVSVLLENSIDENEFMAKELNKLGIKTTLDSNETYNHIKLIISDSKTALLGSTNLSYMSLEENNETNLLIVDTATAISLQKFVISGTDPQPFVLIKENYVNSLIEKLNNAKNEVSILMYDFRVYDKYPNSPSNEIAHSIIETAKRGITVKIILEKSDFDEQLNWANQNTAEYFAKNGVIVKFESPYQISHAKLAIIDNGAFVGSANWNYKSLALNTEANIFTTNPQTINKFKNYFENIWGNSKGFND